jgi:hypothetical protein
VPQWRELPEKVVDRNVLGGLVTQNGQFIIVVEKDVIRLLTLQGAYEGGLTCSDKSETWSSSIRPALDGVSAISLLAREEYGRLEVIAADGHGHVVFSKISIRNMPSPPSPHTEQLRPHEMSNHAAIGELSSGENSLRHSGSTLGSTLARLTTEDRIEAIPE